MPSNKICLEAVFYKFAELVQTLDIFIIELSVGYRGNIEIECDVRADGVEICVKESFERMSLLGVPIEPARADGHINFRRSEYKTFRIYNIAKRADVLVGVVHIRKVARKRTRIGLYLAERAELGVSVPGGKIETELQSVVACVGKLSDNIVFAVFIRAVFYAVVGVFARSETESVVMFCCDNSSLHAGGFECFAPLIAVELCWIEYSRESVPCPHSVPV